MAAITGVSVGCTRAGRALAWALMTTFMSPWRYSSTSRERCRATGRKPIVSSTWPSACGSAGGVFDELDAVQAQRVGQLADGFAVGCRWHAPAPSTFRPRGARPAAAGNAPRTRAASAARPVKSSKAPIACPTAMRAAVDRGAAARARRLQQLGVEREVDDLGHPQPGAQQFGRQRQAGQLVHAGGRGVDQPGGAVQRRGHVGAGRHAAGAVQRVQLRSRGRARVGLAVDDHQLLRAQAQHRMRDGRAGAAGAEQHHAAQVGLRQGARGSPRPSPLPSVLWPMARPSRKTTVLTAPIARASSDRSSSSGITACLQG